MALPCTGASAVGLGRWRLTTRLPLPPAGKVTGSLYVSPPAASVTAVFPPNVSAVVAAVAESVPIWPATVAASMVTGAVLRALDSFTLT